jgi:cysteine desulfurase/selenocysteine lyase
MAAEVQRIGLDVGVQPILRRMGLEATVRPSFAFYNNTFDEIDVFIDAVRRIAEGGASRS